LRLLIFKLPESSIESIRFFRLQGRILKITNTDLVLYSLTTVRDFSFQSFMINSDILSVTPKQQRQLQHVDVDVERKQAQAIASLPDSITHYYAYSNEDITVISLRLPVP